MNVVSVVNVFGILLYTRSVTGNMQELGKTFTTFTAPLLSTTYGLLDIHQHSRTFTGRAQVFATSFQRWAPWRVPQPLINKSPKRRSRICASILPSLIF